MRRETGGGKFDEKKEKKRARCVGLALLSLKDGVGARSVAAGFYAKLPATSGQFNKEVSSRLSLVSERLEMSVINHVVNVQVQLIPEHLAG